MEKKSEFDTFLQAMAALNLPQKKIEKRTGNFVRFY